MRWMLEPLGEDAVLLRLGDAISPEINRRVHALAARLDACRPAWLREIVPAYASLALIVEPGHPEIRDAPPLDRLHEWLAAQALDATAPRPDDDGPAAIVDIPTCYDGDCAPDLDDVAAHAGLKREDVVARHTGTVYIVGMLGFAPGFPYLIGLDPALAMPRRATPRVRVPAGSVAIGGAQTGLYPRESPGGWQVIGRTPLQLFDPERPQPSLLAPGQRVRFAAIDRAQWDATVGAARHV